jgi:hypothetical protein
MVEPRVVGEVEEKVFLFGLLHQLFDLAAHKRAGNSLQYRLHAGAIERMHEVLAG